MTSHRDRIRSKFIKLVETENKYMNQQPYVPYFYQADFDVSDEVGIMGSNGGWIGIYVVTDEDRDLFPELKGKRLVYLYEHSRGGIVEEISSNESKAFAKALRDAWKEIVENFEEILNKRG
jgi:hypothetical protein